ncbi:Cyclin-like protein [Pseudocohnilembus persalinus]|uniref:Cyclin-like protein n=1 Tax=Pseudocohnilembus persalinus TaxID=266149 RepID=A0A0V0R8P8_PSEPJ|nr:Cyclin-like protein [Pseudocohnilembus persalinus]|eukprot:KRX10752.1 Cyclin-like protein [Pseudocohnilembus persalinus]
MPGQSNINTVKNQQQILSQLHKQRLSTNQNATNTNYNYMQNQDKKENISIANFNSQNSGTHHAQIIQKNKQKNQFMNNLDLSSLQNELIRIQKQDKNDPLNVAEYANEVNSYLKSQEDKYQITGKGMAKQEEINEKQRAILIDWLVDVHYQYKMIPQTLYMTVMIIDKFIEKNQVPRSKLQLLGVTSLFIAGKYEEIYPPQLKEYVDLTDKTYRKNEVLDMEGKIINSLQFNITYPYAYTFLDRFTRIINSNEKTLMLCRYIIELALIDFKFVKYSQSMIAASSLYVANIILSNKGPKWSDILQYTTQFTERDVRPCAKELCLLFQNAPNMKHQAVRRKFAHEKFLQVSKIEIERIEKQETTPGN